ncbi:MAG: hypothetical protein JXA77_00065 [Bacteroidales bacterium]|nr:hypothetical protein [Bacteroidales bacterium]MBN2821266.1 hypothetical protein [Bacteroidales bacterium]
MKKTFIILFLGLSLSAHSQSKFDYYGYLSGMPQYMHIDSINYYQGILHNRMNFFYYPNNNFSFSVQLRNQLLYGDLVEMSAYEDGFVSESYFLPLTFQQTFNDKGFLSLSADRFYGQYTKGNFDIKVGRQRINWGQTFAWNPNDIFNTYNFFDFDYLERPGADAIRIQYFTGATSQLDFAAKIDSANNITAAALYRFNKWRTDFQVIGGYYSQSYIDTVTFHTDTESDYVLGLSFTTDLKGVSLRTESSYMIPTDDSPFQKDLLLISVGLDYTLPVNLSFVTEFFYTNQVQPMTSGLLSMYSRPMTVKSMVFTHYNLFAQASYPVTPLINASFGGMVFTDENLDGFYVGPSIDYSLNDNLVLAVYGQIFGFRTVYLGEVTETLISMGFLRLKWSF